MRQQLRRWLRCFVTVLSVMWLLLMTLIDHELSLLTSNRRTNFKSMQPVPPQEEPGYKQWNSIWRRDDSHGDVETDRAVRLKAITVQNKSKNADAKEPAQSTPRMKARVTEDTAVDAAAVQEKKVKRKDNKGITRRKRKMKGLREHARKKRRKIANKDAKPNKTLKDIHNVTNPVGPMIPEGVSQEVASNSRGVAKVPEGMKGLRTSVRSVLPKGRAIIWKYEETKVPSEPKVPIDGAVKTQALEPQTMLMENKTALKEKPRIPRDSKQEILAETTIMIEEGGEETQKERKLETQFEKTEILTEGILKTAVHKETTYLSSEGEIEMQVKEENMFAEEKHRIPDQDMKMLATGNQIIITEIEKIPNDERNSTLKQESSKHKMNETNTSPLRKKILLYMNQESKIKISHEVDKMEVSLTGEQIKNVVERVRQVNEAQEILNEEVFGPVLPNTTVLLVQVHKRLDNLRYLVESMEAVQGINESLVIFSHDLWNSAINDFVRNITSFRVLQIFFPFSIQLHPRRFPGTDPRDCAWNATRILNGHMCIGQQDTYGHYREAAFTQIKHHWWWKINRVFEGLRMMQQSTGWVVFLEEDHYVAPDLLHVLRLLLHEKSFLCHHCQVISLGNYRKVKGHIFSMLVETGNWQVTQHNLGYALDRAAWKIIKSCQEFFCTFDDYNWDWTLFRLVQTCSTPKLAMLAVAMSRVHHIGSCGTHIKKKICDVKSEVESLRHHFQANAQSLFPEAFKVHGLFNNSSKQSKPNGGWSDHRDHQLCRDMTNSHFSEYIHRQLELQDSVLQTNLPGADRLKE
ncbi:uncharacterized protein [Panulirus ornatus]|uniref:uncharacterized protein isoform X2 n=1 Tax=Panulirus ornatus TaxID=150431 RepID=UPI003A8C7354